jgi:glyoxylate reductase
MEGGGYGEERDVSEHEQRRRVVVTRKVSDPLIPALRAREGFDVVVHDTVEPMAPRELTVEPMAPRELVEFVRGAHGIVSIADDKITDEVFEAAGPDLKIVANYAVGYDNVDLDAAIARDV